MALQFGESFYRLRQRSGLTQSDLARRAGVSVRTVHNWETGTRMPRTPELQAALNALGASPAERAQLAALLPTPRSVQLVREEDLRDEALRRELGPLPEMGDLLRAMRVRRGWTQEQLAEALQIRRYAVVRWEATQHFPSEESLERLCDALNAFPDERQALRARRLTAPTWRHEPTLDECAALTHDLGRQVDYLLTPLIDLNALALKRRLRILAGQSEEAFRLLAMVETTHSTWLMFQDRLPESRAAAWRSLYLARERTAPQRFWATALNLATFHFRTLANANEASFDLLNAWLPRLPDSVTRTLLLCDMALCMASADRADEANALLAEARRSHYVPGVDDGENYLRITSARVRMRTQRVVEDIDWLLAQSVSDNQRVSYLLLWVETLLAGGQNSAALDYLTAAQTIPSVNLSLRMQRRMTQLLRQF